MTRTAYVILALGLAGCVTHIKDTSDTIQPSKEKLGTFQTVLIRPVTSETTTDSEIVEHVQANLALCLPDVFPGIRPFDPEIIAASAKDVLVIEPIIVDAKKVSVAERVLFRALAGSSAGLLRVRFTSLATSDVIAEPVFYAKASAAHGALSLGGTDYTMMIRLAHEACDYSRANF